MLDKIRIKASLYNGKNKELINHILENDNCFFQMKYETSYNLLKEIGIEVYMPDLKLCTDNAAMIASAGYYNFVDGKRDELDLNAVPNLKL